MSTMTSSINVSPVTLVNLNNQSTPNFTFSYYTKNYYGTL